jgi:hypothetical protein
MKTENPFLQQVRQETLTENNLKGRDRWNVVK